MELEYAGFWRRFLAFIIDGIFLFLICSILLIPFFFLAPLTVIVTFFYYPVFNASVLKGTPGKHMLGMTVTDVDGARLDFKTAIIRHLMSFVSSSLFFIGYMMYFFTEKKQTLHDYVSDTIVIREEQESMNVFHVWWNEMKELFNIQSMTSSSERYEQISPRQSLEDLYELHKKGILNDSEYNSKKEEYLKRL